MTHWKETVIKSKELLSKRPRWKIVEDGKSDILVTIPITDLLECQARRAFAAGMVTMMKFHLRGQNDKKTIEVADVVKLFNDCGLPEVAKQLEDSVNSEK